MGTWRTRARRLLAWVALCATLLSPLGASAAPSADAAATQAFSVKEQFCADTSSSDTTVKASSFSIVADAWAVVSEAYEASAEPNLLYWRGVMAQCLGQSGNAAADLEAFVAAAGENKTFAQQRRDAQLRLRRLAIGARRGGGVTRSAPAPGAAGIVLGAGMGAGSGVLGALSGARWARVRELDADIHGGREDSRSDLDNWIGEAEDATLQSNLLLGAAIGAGVAAAVGLVAGIAGHQVPVAILIAPGRDGALSIGLGARF